MNTSPTMFSIADQATLLSQAVKSGDYAAARAAVRAAHCTMVEYGRSAIVRGVEARVLREHINAAARRAATGRPTGGSPRSDEPGEPGAAPGGLKVRTRGK